MRSILNIAAALVAVFLIFLGFQTLIEPVKTGHDIALETRGITGINEISAIFTGLFNVMGGLILYALWSPTARRPLLSCVGIMMLGATIARVLAIIIHGYESGLEIAIVMELGMSAILLGAAFVSPRTRPAG